MLSVALVIKKKKKVEFQGASFIKIQSKLRYFSQSDFLKKKN